MSINNIIWLFRVVTIHTYCYGPTKITCTALRETFFFSDKKAACFTLGGYLKVMELQTLLQCEIQCCTSSNCNTQTFNLTQNATTVFTPQGNINT